MKTGSHGKHSRLIAAAVGVALMTGAGSVSFAQESDDELKEVVITGSRIARRDYVSQSPIVTLPAQTFENRADLGLESALNQLPQFTAAGTGAVRSTAGTPFPASDAAPGAATVNLRGLGTNRTLVLVDGRRVQPINGTLAVDLNTIPAAAIDRVEVITGGAAAVYGADAIAGVVNLILKKNFQGAEFSGQYGLTQEGDGADYQVNALLGSSFADDRGSIMLGANFANRQDILGRDRGWVRRGWDDPGTTGGGIGNSYLQQFNPGLFNLSTAGFSAQGGTGNYGINSDGSLFDPTNPQDPAHPYTGPLGGDSGFKVNPDGTLGYNDRAHSYLQLPLQRYALFGSTHYKLTGELTFFTDLRFSETLAQAKGAQSSLFNIWSPTVPYDPQCDDPASPTFGQCASRHPVPAAFAALLNARANPSAPWSFVGGLDWLPPFETDTTSNVFQLTSGLRGRVAGTQSWTWEVYGSHGKSSVNAQQPNDFPYLPRIQNLFNADLYGKGYKVPAGPAVGAGACTTGLPIFNPDGTVNDTHSVSQDCADYTVLKMNSITTLTQEVVEANIQGTLFKLPAGELQFAAGADSRREQFRFDPDSNFNANQDHADVVGNIILPLSVKGETSAKEAYVELAIPLLHDIPGIKRLELDPGYRYSHYNTSGNTSTYKILADWQVIDWVRFRGGYQKANRAANVTELFTPKGGSRLSLVSNDACGSWDQIPSWGNKPENPNRLNVQSLCQYLMQRDGAPASLYVPGEASANDYRFNVFGQTFFFPFDIAVTEGNRNLQSEKADTVTAGVVFTSPFAAAALQHLTFSIDYFDIEVKGAIGTPLHDVVYQQCLDAQFNTLVGDAPGSHTGAELAAGNPFCAFINREYLPAAGSVFGADRTYAAQYLNQGGIKSQGVDVQLDWSTQLPELGLAAVPGTFSANILFSHLDQYAVSAFPGAAFIDNTGTVVNSSFDYRLFTTFGYANGPLSVGLRWQHLPSLDPAPGSASTVFGVKSHDQFDLFGRWSLSRRYELRAGVDNMLDANPEVVGANTTNNALGTTSVDYDQFGRRFYLAFKASF